MAVTAAAAVLVVLLAISGSSALQAEVNKQGPLVKPLIAAHRGFPALIPEETIAGYSESVLSGADFLELDLVSTKDGVLVLRHDPTLDDSTDIANYPQFASRNKTVLLPFDGGNTTGFFISDFTLAELRTLYMTQAFAWRDASKNAQYRIVTFDEVLAYATQVYETQRPIGLYVETKGVEYHDRIGLGLEEKVVQSIANSGLANYSDTAIILQSFEPLALVKMHRLQLEYGLKPSPLVYLVNTVACGPNITTADMDTFQNSYGLPEELLFLGPSKDSLVEYVFDPACNRLNTSACGQQANQTCIGRLSPRYAAANSGSAPFPTDNLIQVAHKRGLGVHPYTFRNEGRYMALDFNNDPGRELDFFYRMGMDGFFIDNPQTGSRWWDSVSNEPYAENPLMPNYN